MTEEYRAALEAMTDDERDEIARVLAKSRHNNICALICSVFTLAGGFGGVDLDFVNSQLPRINEVHAREVRCNDTEDRRLAVPPDQHYVFEPFGVTRCEWHRSFDGATEHLAFYGDFDSAGGRVRDGVIMAAATQFVSQFG